jgi:hypothetical protein
VRREKRGLRRRQEVKIFFKLFLNCLKILENVLKIFPIFHTLQKWQKNIIRNVQVVYIFFLASRKKDIFTSHPINRHRKASLEWKESTLDI